MFEPNFSLVDCEIVFGFSLLANGRITGEAGKKKVLLATVSRGPQGPAHICGHIKNRDGNGHELAGFYLSRPVPVNAKPVR